ncbi:MAG: hypothetical protein Q7R31_01440 [Candidatus Levybacteria bacterium]|nr:hypothetical protein [Candidatus Levybacteria bacterium]
MSEKPDEKIVPAQELLNNQEDEENEEEFEERLSESARKFSETNKKKWAEYEKGKKDGSWIGPPPSEEPEGYIPEHEFSFLDSKDKKEQK